MLTVYYRDTSDAAIPDGEVKAFVEFMATMTNNLGEENIDFTISNEVVIDAIRLAIRKGKIKHKDIVFVFDDRRCFSDKEGNLEFYPLSVHNDILLELLCWKDDSLSSDDTTKTESACPKQLSLRDVDKEFERN
jgi:hypothetical protein